MWVNVGGDQENCLQQTYWQCKTNCTMIAPSLWLISRGLNVMEFDCYGCH